MSRDEMIYAVYCLLYDIRLNWSEKVKERVELAIKICHKLGGDFDILAEECKKFGEFGYDEIDGRFFRDDFPYGYYGIEKLHNCSNNTNDKSIYFNMFVDEYITCPDCIFENYRRLK